jgi:hypothetical protein
MIRAMDVCLLISLILNIIMTGVSVSNQNYGLASMSALMSIWTMFGLYSNRRVYD